MLGFLPDFQVIGLGWVLLWFLGAAGVVTLAGVWMAKVADRLADQTGLGEAIVGGVLLGASTSLSGTVVSIASAWDGRASLAFSNGVGGIAAQTAFLAIADIVYRRANLEHASAEIGNLFQAALLLCLLSVPLVAYTAPELTLLGVHPASLVLVGLYVFGVKVTSLVQEEPMWRPVSTTATREDTPDEPRRRGRALAPIVIQFAALVAVLGLCGWVISQSGGRIVDDLGISATTVGALFTAVSTSMPELVTTLAAVRRGAAQLAVGGIIGGNTFDVLFLTLSDIAYRDGSLYHAIDRGDVFWVTVGALMTAVLMMGLIARERRGPYGIGVESVALLGIWAGAILIQAFSG